MKKRKITVIMLLMIAGMLTVEAVVYTASERAMTSSYMPTTACGLGTPFVRSGNNINTSTGPCNDAANNGRFNAYWTFVNITPADSLVFNCTTVYGPGAYGNGRSLLYRVNDTSWNNETITHNNQPAFCVGQSCWNAYGSILSDRGAALNVGGLMNDIQWDLNTVYGEDSGPMDEITLFFADENTSAYSSFSITGCFLVATGIYQQSDVSVYVFDNYAGISGMEVQICTTDYENCTYRFTDSNGYAFFSIPFGDYVIDAEYSIMNLSYSETFSFTDESETVNIHFNTVGPGSIGGYVYWWNGTGAPLAVVNVTGAENYATFTESDGQFLISPITKGNYTIQAYKYGFASELSSFTCVGDDSINLNLQPGVTPPDGFSYHIINITTYYDIGNTLSEVTIEIFGLSSSCTYSCFLSSECRNSFCGDFAGYPIYTDDNGNAIVNRMPPHSPIWNELIIYGHKAGFQEDDQVLNLVYADSNQTDVNLYLFPAQNTSITLHELNDLQNVRVQVRPNIGAPQVNFTDAGGNVTFSFPAVISDIIVEATINNINYDPFTSTYPISGNPVYIAFRMANRTITGFNLEGCLFDDVGNNVSGANVELRCASCTSSGSCGYRTTDADGCYYWWSVPYYTQCFIRALPPSSQYSSTGPQSVTPVTPTTYFNLSPGLLLDDGNTTAETVFLKLLVTDKGTGIPILDGDFDYVVNGTDQYHNFFTNTGYVYIRNLIPGGNVSLQLRASNYVSVSYFIPVGSSNYEANDRLTMTWIGGATTRPTTTRFDQTTMATTTTAATTTTILLLPEDMTVYEMSNESEYTLDTIYNFGMSCIGAMFVFAPAAGAIGLLAAVLFGMKFIEALMPHK